MDRHLATQTAGYASNPCAMTATEADAPQSPVSLAIRNLRDEIGDVHYHADSLIGAISPVLRPVEPANQENKGRPAMASELAEEIQQLADNLRAARVKLIDARERVTL